MANSIKLTFAGDADSLTKAGKKSEQSLEGVGSAADKSGKQLSDASKQSADLGTRMGHLGSAVSGANDAIGTLSGGLQAINDLQNASAEKASKLARALDDVHQAQLDLNQANRDSKQAGLDAEQAQLDVAQANLDAGKAQKDYDDAVRKHGKNSDEAKQAAQDLAQANQDVRQANEDGLQAQQDAAQAVQDAQTAQHDLNDANRDAHPPDMQKWADDLAVVTPLLSAIVGVVGLVTAAQWLWNTALFASPITWIVLAVIALVAIIVIIATKTTWFQDLWKWAWTGIKDAASAAWNWIKDSASSFWSYLQKVWDYFLGIPGKIKSTFASLGEAMFAPFKWAFNKVSDAWNSTIGHLHWTVPGWVPGIGGNSISAPTLPHFHQGGIVPGGLGSETLAVLQAGERVTPAGGGHSEQVVTLQSSGSEWDDMILSSIRRSVGLGGNDPVRVLRSSRG